MSHKGLLGIIILVSVVSVTVYATTFLPTQSTSPFSIFINSIQQDIVLETIHTTDEVLLKKDINLKIVGTQNEGERGRVDLNHNKKIVIESTSGISDSMQVIDNKTEASHHKVVINDSMSSTTPEP